MVRIFLAVFVWVVGASSVAPDSVDQLALAHSVLGDRQALPFQENVEY